MRELTNEAKESSKKTQGGVNGSVGLAKNGGVVKKDESCGC